MSVDWGEKRIHAGQDLVLTGTVKDSTGTVINITGWTLGVWLKNERDDADTYILTSGFYLTDPVNGRWMVTVPRSATVSRAGKRYFGEVWRTDDGSNSVLSNGMILFLATARPAS